MAEKVFYGDDARQRVLAGAEALYEAVKTTMGPTARNVVISKRFQMPNITHDGVTVAKSITLAEEEETLGHQTGSDMIKQAANKMNDVAGDGTTTVTVLTYHILNEANKLIAAGHNPMLLRRELEAASAQVIAGLSKLSESIKNKKGRIAEVATISAGDPVIGTLIADVMEVVGAEGVVTVEESQKLELQSEVVNGYTFDRGYVSPYMVTDTNRMKAIYYKPHIVITDRRVSNIQEFLPLLERLAQSGKKDLLLIAKDIEGEALGALILNKLKAVFSTVAVKAPSFGERQDEILEDLAALTGATVISETAGMGFEDATLDMVGSAAQVIVSKDETTIVEGDGATADVKRQLKQIKTQIKESTSAYAKEQQTARLAALAGQVAVIRVGGATQMEVEEKKYRIDDAVHAVKAALDEGIVPGGGVSLLNLAVKLPDTPGAGLLKAALMQPFRILLSNAGLNPDEWLPQIIKSEPGQGVDVTNPSGLVDLKATGVVDPTRVAKEAIQNAVSIAGTAITMGALVVELPPEKTENLNPAPM